LRTKGVLYVLADSSRCPSLAQGRRPRSSRCSSRNATLAFDVDPIERPGAAARRCSDLADAVS